MPAGRRETAGTAASAGTGKPLPKPADVTVNVLNATARGGLAKSTADELRKRGFKVGKVGNAPPAYDKKVKGTGVLLGAQTASDGAGRCWAPSSRARSPRRTPGRPGTSI